MPAGVMPSSEDDVWGRDRLDGALMEAIAGIETARIAPASFVRMTTTARQHPDVAAVMPVNGPRAALQRDFAKLAIDHCIPLRTSPEAFKTAWRRCSVLYTLKFAPSRARKGLRYDTTIMSYGRGRGLGRASNSAMMCSPSVMSRHSFLASLESSDRTASRRSPIVELSLEAFLNT